MPDPACNPYLAFTVMLAAGLDGIDNALDPGAPVNRNVFGMTEQEKSEAGITQLPRDLCEAVDELERDAVLREALGEHIAAHFIAAKREVWREYSAQVGPWELDRYLGAY